MISMLISIYYVLQLIIKCNKYFTIVIIMVIIIMLIAITFFLHFFDSLPRVIGVAIWYCEREIKYK